MVDGYVNIVGVKFITWFVSVILLALNQFKIGGIMVIIKLLFHVVTKVKNKIPLNLSYQLKNSNFLAFIAINNDDYVLNQWLQTGLPQGQYCDIISGNLDQGRCTGKVITVQADGRTSVTISNSEEDPMIAIHLGAKL